MRFTGGECLAPVFQELLGFPSQFHATLVRSGNSVTASSDIDHTGAVCTFKGTIVGNSLVLTETGCSETHTTALGCPNGDVRDLVPESESLHATIDGDRITGTAIETDGVIVSGTPDRAGTFVVMGVVAVLSFHILVNVGMVVGFMPVTGIPLPLMSYGGSSVLFMFLALGIVMNVRMRRFVN